MQIPNVDHHSTGIRVADVARGGIVLEFEDGTTVYYSADFLWANKENGDNKEIPEPMDD
jgi:hypothetical protein